MSAPRPRVFFHDLHPAADNFLQDVLHGLSQPQKTLPPKYFYDEAGSALFDAICHLPEYYPTRAELSIMQRHGPDMARRLGRCEALIEYGSGSGRKTRILLQSVQPAVYVPIDIAREQLRRSGHQIADTFPALDVMAVCADYTQPLALPHITPDRAGRRAIYFSGSSIGNFTPLEAQAFLARATRLAGAGGAMLIGVDLKKDAATLHAAYNDAAGITAQFNLNLLRRINRELEGDFNIDAFTHCAHYDIGAGRIEMHLVSRDDQRVTVAGRKFSFRRDETIHTENSYKYSISEFQQLAHGAGYIPETHWLDEGRRFSVHYLVVRESAL